MWGKHRSTAMALLQPQIFAPQFGAGTTLAAAAPPASPWWPDLAQMRSATHTRRSNLGRQLKLAWALLSALPHRAQFHQVLRQHPHWLPLFSQQPRSFEPLLQSFIDRRYRTAQRFAHLQHDLASATQAFGAATCARIARGERVELWHLTGVGPVCLEANRVCRREGLWSLGLWTDAGLRLCQLSFSVLRGDRLTIGSVQGAPAHDAQAMQGVRDATHAAAGLRPPHLLVELLRVLCQRGCLALQGVDPQHHVKRRWHQRVLAVSFDYCGFWAGLGGQRLANGFWSLPAQRPPRDLADVPAKRRAMYRRRSALLDAVSGQLMHLPGLAQPVPLAA